MVGGELPDARTRNGLRPGGWHWTCWWGHWPGGHYTAPTTDRGSPFVPADWSLPGRFSYHGTVWDRDARERARSDLAIAEAARRVRPCVCLGASAIHVVHAPRQTQGLPLRVTWFAHPGRRKAC